MFKVFRLISLLSVVFYLSACGLFVPQIRDFPNNNDGKDDVLVQAIIASIHCELKDAVTGVLNDNTGSKSFNNGFDYGAFLRKWGAEVALTLTLDEKSSISPSGLYTPVSPLTSVFTMSGGLGVSSDAQRVDKVNYYYKVTDLYMGPGNPKCVRDTNPPPESLLIQSDLKLREWLSAVTTASASGTITTVGKQNVLSHEITFDVATNGNLTPSWKLVTGSINPGGTFLTTSRDRKHDLIVTFGPLDKTQTALIPVAESAHNTSLIVNGLKGALSP